MSRPTCEDCRVNDSAITLHFSRHQRHLCTPCWTAENAKNITAPYPRPEPDPDESPDGPCGAYSPRVATTEEIVGGCVHGGPDDGCDSCAEVIRLDECKRI